VNYGIKKLNSQGALGCLRWDFTLSDLMTLVILVTCLRWDFVVSTWNFELSDSVISLMTIHWLSYHIILVACTAAILRERTQSLTLP